MFVKKWPLEYQQVIKTYLHTYQWDSSDSHDSHDSSNSSDSSDCSDKNAVTKFPSWNLHTFQCNVSDSSDSSDSSATYLPSSSDSSE